ncbi:MAG: ABC transporter ATP-binding protein [Puniceicoccales bacterium]
MSKPSQPEDRPELKREPAAKVRIKGAADKVSHEISLARSSRRPENKTTGENATDQLNFALFRRLFSWTRAYGPKRYVLFAAVILRATQLPLLAWSLSAIINGPIADGNYRETLIWAAGYAVFAMFTQVVMHFRQRYALELGETVVYEMRNAVFCHLMKMPMSFYNRTKHGSILSRLTSDMESVRQGVQSVLFVSLVQLGQMLISGVLMAFYNWILFLALLGMTPIVWFINRYFRRRISHSSRNLQESFSRVTATVAESVQGIHVTQGFAREETNAGLFRRLIADHSGYNMGLSRNIARYLPLLELNAQVFTAILVILGGYGALNPSMHMDIGDLVTFFFLAGLFFQPISAIGRQFTSALAALAGAERVFRLLDQKPDWDETGEERDPQDPPLVPLKNFSGRVRFEDLSFHYEPEKPVLKKIQFTADPGQMIALVGHTGSGKSTIINLLCKFYLPTEGRILFDDRDIRDLQTASLRSQIGIVLQRNFLFSGTVRENIRVGRPDATDEEVEEAVRQLNCLDLVESMSNGFETVVTERGQGLSLGQRQIVCFARALLANPKILILDEATSSVDTMTEARLQSALETLLQGRTCFVVAHRLSTIRKADQVLVLDHGRIIERGTHHELLSEKGHYADLYRRFSEE